ncbi:MAG: hypothetical protein AB8G16_00785 [Gammaproteobacteria bacterium]
MLWIKSYLSEVGRYLPPSQREDILTELETSLSEQAQDLANGQAPTDKQQQQVIDRMGHPMKVASGYDKPRYLIGPELFPTYLQVLKIAFVVVALIQCAIQLSFFVLTGWSTSFFGLFKGLLDTLLWASVVVTIIFFTAEYFGERLNFYDSWRASSLKPHRTSSAISYSDMITNLVSEGVFLLWWNSALSVQNWIPGADGVLTVALSDTWAPLFWPLNLLFGAWFLLHAGVFIRGLWHNATLWLEIGLGLAGLAIAAWLLLQPPLLQISGALSEHATIHLERIVFTVIVVVAGFIAWDVYVAAKRLRGGRYAEDSAIALP